MGSSTEYSVYGPTRNPINRAYVSGGSSGGSTAAVAANQALFGIGTETGGSVRLPASYCGVYGLKPTYGVLSRWGVVAYGSSLDQVGPFGRSVSDVALAMNALVGDGKDPYDCTSQNCPVDFLEHLNDDIAGRRVGIIPAFMEAEGLMPEVKRAVELAAEDAVAEHELPGAVDGQIGLGPDGRQHHPLRRLPGNRRRLENHLFRPVRLAVRPGNTVGVGQVARYGVQPHALRRQGAAGDIEYVEYAHGDQFCSAVFNSLI